MPTIGIKFKGVELEIEYTYHRASRGLREKSGAQITPDEPEELIVECIKVNGVDITELVEDHMEAIEAKILEEIRGY